MGRRLTTAQLEALARRVVADALTQGEAGELDGTVYRALKDGLAMRGAGKKPRLERTNGGT